jgi:hypothetical protein
LQTRLEILRAEAVMRMEQKLAAHETDAIKVQKCQIDE